MQCGDSAPADSSLQTASSRQAADSLQTACSRKPAACSLSADSLQPAACGRRVAAALASNRPRSSWKLAQVKCAEDVREWAMSQAGSTGRAKVSVPRQAVARRSFRSTSLCEPPGRGGMSEVKKVSSRRSCGLNTHSRDDVWKGMDIKQPGSALSGLAACLESLINNKSDGTAELRVWRPLLSCACARSAAKFNFDHHSLLCRPTLTLSCFKSNSRFQNRRVTIPFGME